MDKDMAWAAIQTAFRCGAELQNLLAELKQKCSAEDYKKFAAGIATSIDTVNVQLIDRALKAHPDLEDRIESDLKKTGRIS
jgi:hypothetical protein